MSCFPKLQAKARQLAGELHAIYLAYRDPRTPWPAKLVIVCVIAYALSPIDLIPDFIPVLGYLDDLILLPLGIALSLRLIPPEVLADCRAKAHAGMRMSRRSGWIAAIIIIAVWCALGLLGVCIFRKIFSA